ncbi:agmatinase- variant [Apiospora hydei]|uniref:Agmatinase- variant n=1 Tax=Apiospora hydei TaxID=1337664 RepID=A0ABR1VXW1_9PEZI
MKWSSIVSFGFFLAIRPQQVLAWQFPRPPAMPPHAPQQHRQKTMFGESSLHGLEDDDVDIVTGSQFNGLRTYANLPYVNCLSEAEAEKGPKYDIAILGAPFDTASPLNPISFILQSWATVVDCGDVPLTWLDNNVALKQLDKAHRVRGFTPYTLIYIITSCREADKKCNSLKRSFLGERQRMAPTPSHRASWPSGATTRRPFRPCDRLMSDGARSRSFISTVILTLPRHLGPRRPRGRYIQLRGLKPRHLPAHRARRAPDPQHLDPRGDPGPLIRAKGDLRNDLRCGFAMVKARELDKIGAEGVIRRIKERVGGSKVYISVDIDVLDPAFAPATGTAEPGGWSTRELLTILDGLQGLHVVGADVVEVSPIYDNPGETTVLAAAEVALSLIELMVENPVKSLADA